MSPKPTKRTTTCTRCLTFAGQGLLVAALILCFGSLTAASQSRTPATAGSDDVLHGAYDPSPEYPFGRLNPEAPPETSQYGFMVGEFDCKLAYKAFRDGEWVDDREGFATWNARYIMNGFAILDEFRDDHGATNVDVRAFDVERGKWLVHYTTVNPVRSSQSEAERVDGKMVMYVDRETPGGYAYTERISFEPLAEGAYHWTQEIVYSDTVSVVNSDIVCRRR